MANDLSLHLVVDDDGDDDDGDDNDDDDDDHGDDDDDDDDQEKNRPPSILAIICYNPIYSNMPSNVNHLPFKGTSGVLALKSLGALSRRTSNLETLKTC